LLHTKVADLQKSRDRWKRETKQLRSEVKGLQDEVERLQAELEEQKNGATAR
jgi:predicted  nucleic acid-binding Zn-ribbon protein